MDRLGFKNKYYDLYQFLGSFVEQCYEPVSDEKIIDTFTSIEDYKNNIIPQAHEVLRLSPFPEKTIEDITNIWHKNQSTKDWFASIVAKLEAKVAEAKKNKVLK